MARPERTAYRDRWWEEKLKAASTPKAKVTVLQSKIAADLSRLPGECQEEATGVVVLLLEGIVDELAIKWAELEWVG